jgi:CubicO group peptidase (beta-lactamase class C family)
MRSVACAAVVLAMTLWPVLGEPATPNRTQVSPTFDDAIAAVAAYGPRALKEQGAPGMSVAITDRTHTLKILTFGYSDLDAKIPVTDQTRFWIYSITKSMTSLALLQQHDAGRLDLQAPIQRYLPWFSIHSGGKPILIHELLSHTAGLPTFYSSANNFTFGVAALRSAHVLFAPGTSWAYSNLGYITLGTVLASLEHRSWPDSLAADVFAPIGMTHTSAYYSPALASETAVGYGFRDYDLAMPPNPPLIGNVVTNDYIDPAGSVVSTPEDMAKYIRFYLNGAKTETGRQVLSQKTFVAMTTPDHLNNGKAAGAKSVELSEWPEFYRQYGYGLSVFFTNGDHLIGHTGGGGGYAACMQANLTRGFGVIAMSNLSEEPLHPCAIVRYAMSVLRAQSLGRSLPPAPPPPPDPALAKNASDYTGKFSSTSATLFITARVGHLLLSDNGNQYKLISSGKDTFWTDDPKFKVFNLIFERNKAKMVDDLLYGPRLYTNGRYNGPRTFKYPARYDTLVGRYEDNTGYLRRVVLVKGRLTLDGTEPLVDRKDGSFGASDQIVRFDTPAGGLMQRLWIDDVDLYRVDLP